MLVILRSEDFTMRQVVAILAIFLSFLSGLNSLGFVSPRAHKKLTRIQKKAYGAKSLNIGRPSLNHLLMTFSCSF